MRSVPSTRKLMLFFAATGAAVLMTVWNAAAVLALFTESSVSQRASVEEKLKTAAGLLADELLRAPRSFEVNEQQNRERQLAERLWRICEAYSVAAPAIAEVTRLDPAAGDAALRADDALNRACRMQGVLSGGALGMIERRAAEVEIRGFTSEAVGAFETAAAALREGATPSLGVNYRSRRLGENLLGLFIGLAGCWMCAMALLSRRAQPAARPRPPEPGDELRDELTPVGCYCDLVLDNLPPGDANRADIEEIRRASARATRVLSGGSDGARQQAAIEHPAVPPSLSR